MTTLRTTGWLSLGFAVLLLAACAKTEEASPSGSPTAAVSSSMTVSPSPDAPSPSPLSPSPSTAPVESPSVAPTAAPTETTPPEGAPPSAKEAASTVLAALQAGDMKTVAAWAHPDKGVRFSPYGFVDVESDLVLTRQELEGAMKDITKRTWGHYDGSGDPITLSYKDYHKKFVYSADFVKDAQVTENKSVGKGNSSNNIREVYPADHYSYVEYYIDGIDPQYEGIDWRSLRLVFEKMGEDHALVAIIQDQWTI
jgi:hypothetical protein